MTSRRQPTPPVEVIVVVAIVVLTAIWMRWDAIPLFPERHISNFEQIYDVDVGDPGRWFTAWARGDGQAYALIAIDPSGGVLADRIHEAGYRFARAGYGWAVWAVSLGRSHVVPHALAIVSVLSVAGVMVMSLRLRPRLGPRSWLIVLNPALFIGFAADTSEPMGILLLAAALAGSGWWSVGLLGVTRPTFLVALWGRWRELAAGVGAAVALATYGFIVFGAGAMVPSSGRLALPFHAYLDQPSVLAVSLALVATGTLAIGIRDRDWSWVLAGLFVLCFGHDVLRNPVNAWRAAGFLPVIWAFGKSHSNTDGPDGELHPAATSVDVA